MLSNPEALSRIFKVVDFSLGAFFAARFKLVCHVHLVGHILDATLSNDETVKLWSTDGELLSTFKGHNGFVFAITTLLSGEIASGGDDCTVKIWRTDGTCK